MKGAHVSHHVSIEYRSLNLVKMLLNVCGRWVNEVHPHGRETCRKKIIMFHCFSVKWTLSSVVCAIDFACEVDDIVRLVSVWK